MKLTATQRANVEQMLWMFSIGNMTPQPHEVWLTLGEDSLLHWVRLLSMWISVATDGQFWHPMGAPWFREAGGLEKGCYFRHRIYCVWHIQHVRYAARNSRPSHFLHHTPCVKKMSECVDKQRLVQSLMLSLLLIFLLKSTSTRGTGPQESAVPCTTSDALQGTV